MMSAVITAIALVLAAYLALSRKLAGSSDWKGSGFLVSAPLLAGVVGDMALVYMSGLLVLAYFVGGTIRFNIRYFEPIEQDGQGAVPE